MKSIFTQKELDEIKKLNDEAYYQFKEFEIIEKLMKIREQKLNRILDEN